MNKVLRVYTSDSTLEPPTHEYLTKQDLFDENIGYESFAEDVWESCIDRGMYDDSDPSSNVICMYFFGE